LGGGKMTPIKFILTAIAGFLVGFGIGAWFALMFRNKSRSGFIKKTFGLGK
tara:strand:- start:1363 stop:1515 length:153 start_codon:yes stop_codon:yes gene_type:complete